MKKFIGIPLLIIAIAIAWKFYFDHQTKTFIEGLPEIPVETQNATRSPASTDTDEPHETLQTSPAPLEATETVQDATSPDEPNLNKTMEAQHPQTPRDYDWRTDNTPHTTPHKTDPWAEKPTQQGNSTHFSEMSPDDRADHLRDSWIRMFGDIPEVHTASDYLRKVMKNERMTIDEVIAGLEASHHLFPKNGFNMRLQHYKSMKEMGIPILYPDDIE